MGLGPIAVIDERLCLHGIVGLRVVNCSIMPTLVSGNISAPAVIVAEKAAEADPDGCFDGHDRVAPDL